ncbi:hypothetical protein D9M71_770020 [compost metagenome]
MELSLDLVRCRAGVGRVPGGRREGVSVGQRTTQVLACVEQQAAGLAAAVAASLVLPDVLHGVLAPGQQLFRAGGTTRENGGGEEDKGAVNPGPMHALLP